MYVAHVERQRSYTGQTRRVHFVARTLAERGHRVVVIAHPGSELARRAREDGVEVLELPLRGWRLMPSTLRAAWKLRGRAIEIFHCHGGRDRKLAFAVASWLRIPHVVRTKHNHSAPHTARSLRDYQRCDRVITVSESVRATLVAAGVDAHRVEAIPDAVDVDRFVPQPRDAELARSFGIEPGDRVIGNVSSLHRRKGIDVVLEAFGRLCRERPGAALKCLLVGKQHAIWRERVAALGLAERVRFPGFRDDVPECLALLDVFVLPSTQEALGTSALEAMALERPVVVTRVGGLAECVTPETGIRVEPGDVTAVVAAVAGLLDDPARAAALGQAGRKRVLAHYSDHALADRTLAAYARVLAGGPDSTPPRGGPDSTPRGGPDSAPRVDGVEDLDYSS